VTYQMEMMTWQKMHD